MDAAEIKDILCKCKTIAIVGLSDDKVKHSYRVAAYLQQKGYRIVPINPNVQEVLGEKSHPSLFDVPDDIKKLIDVVDIFRRPQFIMEIVEQVIKIKKKFGKPYVVWMQLGIVNPLACKKALGAGLIVVMDKCLMSEHQRLI